MCAARKTPEEQYQMVLECRRSGLSDCDWCRKNGINPNTFYTWISRLRKKACYAIPSIEIEANGISFRFSGPVDASLYEKTLLMIGDISIKTNLYIICGYTDMRRSIDGLCAIIQDRFHAQPDGASVYLFCGKRCDRISTTG